MGKSPQKFWAIYLFGDFGGNEGVWGFLNPGIGEGVDPRLRKLCPATWSKVSSRPVFCGQQTPLKHAFPDERSRGPPSALLSSR
eukprot:4468219-Amphidinium_carterae.1